MRAGAGARTLAATGAVLLALALLLPADVAWGGPLLAGFVFLVLPIVLLAWVFAWMAGAALPLTLLAWLALPRRWLSGVPAATVFCAAMLVAPVLFLSGMAAVTLAGKELVWEEFAWAPTERPAPSPTMRHLFPTRPASTDPVPTHPSPTHWGPSSE